MNIYNLLSSINHNPHYLIRYQQFILTCRNQTISKNGANHHILPRSMFPAYSNFITHPWNKVALTHRQHFIAHWLLWKAYPNNKSMITAFWAMKNRDGQVLNSKVYEKLRIELSKFVSKNNRKYVSVKDKDGNTMKVLKDDPRYLSGELVGVMKGVKWSEETREKMKNRKAWNKGLTKENDPRIKAVSEKMKGVPKSEAHCAAMRKPKSNTDNMKKPKSELHKQKLREANLGKKHSEATKQKMKGRIPWNKGIISY